MNEPEPLIIIGAGLAGISAAGAARDTGFTGRIILISDEIDLPYDRPPLSKRVLLEPGNEDKIALRSESWFSEQGIKFTKGVAVCGIDRDSKAVRLDDGRTLTYGRLIIATGSRVKRLPFLESGPLPVHYLRTRDDAIVLRNGLARGKRVCIIGGGVIGLEVAGSARKLGCDVTVIEASDRLMARSVSPSISHYLERYHTEKGVVIKLSARLEGQTASTNGASAAIQLEGGEQIDCDVLVAGIGVYPEIELAEAAGIACDGGILVDANARTNDPFIFAAGDVTAFTSALYGRQLRLETWQHAQNHGAFAGRNAVADLVEYDDVPWFWSDQHELNLQLVGLAIGDSEVVRNSDDDNSFVTFYLDRGRLVGAALINAGGQKRPIQKLISARASIPAEQLSDPSVRLRSLT